MKKDFILQVLLIFFVGLFLLSLVSSESLQEIKETADKIENTVDKVANEDTRQAYLQEQWMLFLTNTKLGKKIYAVAMSPAKIDPVWQFFLGMKFEWSFLFFTVLAISILLVSYSNRIYKMIGLVNPTLKWVSIIVTLVIVSFIGISHIIAKAVIATIAAIPGIFTRIIAWIVVVAIWFVLLTYSKAIYILLEKIEKNIEQYKQKRKVQKVEQEIEQIKEKQDKASLYEGEFSNEDGESAL